MIWLYIAIGIVALLIGYMIGYKVGEYMTLEELKKKSG